MKRYGNIFPRLYDFGYLYRSYKKALKGSGYTKEAQTFTFHLEKELISLSEALCQKTYQPAPYRLFQIFEPKKRVISVAPFRDRVVHHAIVGVLEPIIDPTFIFDSYATRKGKGTHAALDRAQGFCRKYRWFFKADISQYFDSIQHSILLNLIRQKIKDSSFMDIAGRVISNGGLDGVGLPIGNLTSQFFANVYLNPLDHFIKQKLKVKGYLRYMDDFVIFSNEKDQLKYWKKHIEDFLEDKLILSLKPKACFLNQKKHGLGFLGARIFPGMIRLQYPNRMRIRKRLKRRKKEFMKKAISEAQYQQILNSYFSHLDHFQVQPFRKQLVNEIG